MFEPWIALTIFAAFCQNLRSALQKHLKDRLSTAGATYVRFAYGVPFIILYVAALTQTLDQPLPAANARFALFTVVGSIAQIGATALLVHLFAYRNFAVGTTYSKTETVQTALFGAIILGDRTSMGALAGILISLAGVVAISASRQHIAGWRLLAGLTERPALIGIASGGLFGVAAVSFRAAALALDGDSVAVRAGFTLLCAVFVQTLTMTVYFLATDPGALRRILAAWRPALLVGLAGICASIGWFTAMALENAAYVRALGQVELLFTFAASALVFGERSTRAEIFGIVLVTVGIVVLVLTR